MKKLIILALLLNIIVSNNYATSAPSSSLTNGTENRKTELKRLRVLSTIAQTSDDEDEKSNKIVRISEDVASSVPAPSSPNTPAKKEFFEGHELLPELMDYLTYPERCKVSSVSINFCRQARFVQHLNRQEPFGCSQYPCALPWIKKVESILRKKEPLKVAMSRIVALSEWFRAPVDLLKMAPDCLLHHLPESNRFWPSLSQSPTTPAPSTHTKVEIYWYLHELREKAFRAHIEQDSLEQGKLELERTDAFEFSDTKIKLRLAKAKFQDLLRMLVSHLKTLQPGLIADFLYKNFTVGPINPAESIVQLPILDPEAEEDSAITWLTNPFQLLDSRNSPATIMAETVVTRLPAIYGSLEAQYLNGIGLSASDFSELEKSFKKHLSALSLLPQLDSEITLVALVQENLAIERHKLYVSLLDQMLKGKISLCGLSKREVYRKREEAGINFDLFIGYCIDGYIAPEERSINPLLIEAIYKRPDELVKTRLEIDPSRTGIYHRLAEKYLDAYESEENAHDPRASFWLQQAIKYIDKALPIAKAECDQISSAAFRIFSSEPQECNHSIVLDLLESAVKCRKELAKIDPAQDALNNLKKAVQYSNELIEFHKAHVDPDTNPSHDSEDYDTWIGYLHIATEANIALASTVVDNAQLDDVSLHCNRAIELLQESTIPNHSSWEDRITEKRKIIAAAQALAIKYPAAQAIVLAAEASLQNDDQDDENKPNSSKTTT